ncbi:MAG: hypothetical protein COA58_09640 [Bacteroidetes bacterium]|nr:MAG: hypothetical protein COA58_09640 [Bacteroidota bacterium]
MIKNVVFFAILLCSVTSYSQSVSQAPWQQDVDYLIDVKLDDVNHTLSGEMVITYTNNSPDTLNEMYIHLWANGYKNNNTAFGQQMEENGEMDFYYSKEQDRGFIENVSFSSQGQTLIVEQTKNIDVIKILLTEPLPFGEKVVLLTPFKVKLPKVFSRLGHEDQDYFITQWYPKPAVYDVNGWNPMPYLNMGEFYSEFGSFKVNVTLPENYTVVATGECQTIGELSANKPGLGDSVSPSSSRLKTVQFTASNVHDFAWFASKRWGYVTTKIKVGDKEVLARVVAAEPDAKNLKHIETAITYYSENVGAYPYSHATVVHGELKAGGGMEYPMITLCDFMGEEVIIHEVGHNWFYGILANNEREYPWMDESINSYYEGKAMKRGDKLDPNSLIMGALVKDNLLRSEHQAISTSSIELTNGNYGMSVYGIGSSSFGYLEAYLGAQVFKECMTTYFDTWKFKHPLPDDMKKSFEATSGKNLTWFFDEVLTTDKKIDYAVCKHKKGFELKNKSDITVPIPLEITRNGEASTEWYEVFPGKSIIIEDSSAKRSAIVDPKGVTLDLHKGNNSTNKTLKLKIGSGRDKPDLKEIYAIPVYGWNAYDKSMLGIGFHNYSVGNKPLQYHVFPMYSFQKKSLNGTAGINYTKPLNGKAQFIEIGAEAKSFNYLERGFKQEYKYLKVAPYLTYRLPKKTQRSPVNKTLKLQYDQLFFSPQFDIERDTLSGPNSVPTEASRNFLTLAYKIENKRNINGYSWEVRAEWGKVSQNVIVGDTANPQSWYDVYDSVGTFLYNRKYFPFLREDKVSDDLLRLSSVFKYNFDIGLKDKPIELRVYGVYTFNNIDKQGQYQNTIGSTNKAGYYDYRFDDYLLHRNATYGVFQNQISNRRDFSKLVGLLADNESWLMNVNVTVPLPGKIPVKPYFEFLMYEDLDKETWNKSESKMIYNLGLELEIIPDRFEIFFNLAQSSDFTDYQEGVNYPSNINGFAERITFVLDINNLMPSKLKRQLKLF